MLSAFPTGVLADDADFDFLIGDWSTSDGVKLSFYDDNVFSLEWGFMPYEEGNWEIEPITKYSCKIEMDGSTILKLMSTVYGTVNSNYHFEVIKCNEDNFYLVQVYGKYTASDSPCKLGFTRESAQRDFGVPQELSEIEEKFGTTEDISVKKKSVTMYWHDKEVTLDINWGWELFNKSATEYDHNLAMAGAVISQLVHDSNNFENNLKSVFEFDNVQYNKDSFGFIPALAFAHKKVEINSKTKHIVLVAIRGTNLGNNKDDAINDVLSQFNGFEPSRDFVNRYLKSYLSDNKCKKENTILYITGHSLGGAISQSLAPFAESYVSSNDNSFIYTYAAANASVESDKIDYYSNVHNIINIPDVVPDVPFGYDKYGHKWFYDSNDDKYKPYFEKTYKEDGWHSKGLLDDHDIATYIGMLLCEVPTNMGSGANNPYSITSVHCPVDIEVFDLSGNLMCKTENGKALHEENSKVMIVSDGEKKDVYAPNGVQYNVVITGTGEGTMTVKQQSVNPVSNEIIADKAFEDVPVETGKKFQLVVDTADVEDIELEPYGSKSKKHIKSAENESKSNAAKYIIIAVVVLILAAAAVAIIIVLKRKNERKKSKRRNVRTSNSRARASASRAASNRNSRSRKSASSASRSRNNQRKKRR